MSEYSETINRCSAKSRRGQALVFVRDQRGLGKPARADTLAMSLQCTMSAAKSTMKWLRGQKLVRWLADQDTNEITGDGLQQIWSWSQPKRRRN